MQNLKTNKRIIIIRHEETVENKNGIIQDQVIGGDLLHKKIDQIIFFKFHVYITLTV
jgi:hypothetical protein